MGPSIFWGISEGACPYQESFENQALKSSILRNFKELIFDEIDHCVVTKGP